MVYFVRCEKTWCSEGIEAGWIKIGTTRCLKLRLSTLARKLRASLSILGIVAGSRSRETQLHRRFAAVGRQLGEWFEPTEQLLEFIRTECRPWTLADDRAGSVIPGPPVAPVLVGAGSVGRLVGLSEQTVRRYHYEGKLPRPLRISGSLRWRTAEIAAWCEAGCPDRQTWEEMQAATRNGA
jgi:predicted DNA-binding transcriptional regulator AlpA